MQWALGRARLSRSPVRLVGNPICRSSRAGDSSGSGVGEDEGGGGAAGAWGSWHPTSGPSCRRRLLRREHAEPEVAGRWPQRCKRTRGGGTSHAPPGIPRPRATEGVFTQISSRRCAWRLLPLVPPAGRDDVNEQSMCSRRRMLSRSRGTLASPAATDKVDTLLQPYVVAYQRFAV